MTKYFKYEFDWLCSRQLDNHDFIRGCTGMCAFFSFWQPNVLENKPDLHTTLHVKFTRTNNKIDSDGLMQMI